MANNDILPFASTDSGTNLLTQAEYADDAQRLIGNQPGVARSKLVNKALRQASLISAAVAKFIADNQVNNVVDTAAAASIASWMENAIRTIGIPTAVASGTANALTADFTPNVDTLLSNGRTIVVRASAANTSTTPTIAADGFAAKTIVKGSNYTLAVSDIAGAGHWLILQYDSALDKFVLLNPGNGIITKGVASYTSSGIFTVPPGISFVFVSGCGGGGGGAAYSVAGSGGGGGGGAASCYKRAVFVTPSTAMTITIGGGGAGGAVANQAGTAGGTTSFGALLTLGPGTGGAPAGGGGNGGTASGGAGGPALGGSAGEQYNRTAGIASGGVGGGSMYGSGGAGGASTGTAMPGVGMGAGGGGGGGGHGGAGTGGFLVIEW